MGSFNVTIATTPSSGMCISKDIDMIKTGLLYGDKIKLFSMTSPMLMFMRYSSEALSDKEKEHYIWEMLNTMEPGTIVMREILEQLERKKKHRTKDETIEYYKFKKKMEQSKKEIFGAMENMAAKSGINELLPAIERDLIEIPAESVFGLGSSDIDSDDFIVRFVNGIVEETISGKSYPMYDADMANIIRLLSESDTTKIDEIRCEQIKHIATVHNVLAELPNFEKANVADIIGIRDELDRFLAKFKSAMLEYSNEIKSLPWDSNFSNEISLMFTKKIAPTISEIKSVVEQNSFLRKFCTNIVNDRFAVTPIATGIGVPLLEGLSAAIAPLATAIQLPSALVSASIAGGAVVTKNLINSYNSYKIDKQRSEENALFFFYLASTRTAKIK